MTTTTQEHSNGWACADCLTLLANDETPLQMNEAETEAWIAEIDRRSEGTERITLGRMFGEDGCEHTSESWHSGDGTSEEHAEECERLSFSWSSCDVCGSHLGGAREAVTFWLASS